MLKRACISYRESICHVTVKEIVFVTYHLSHTVCLGHVHDPLLHQHRHCHQTLDIVVEVYLEAVFGYLGDHPQSTSTYWRECVEKVCVDRVF